MRFITCASYYGTGSSAVTDYVSEFNSVYSFTNEEFRFIQDPDGISDLEFNLVECFNRHNSGHALKRYKKLVDFYCGNALGRKYTAFLEISGSSTHMIILMPSQILHTMVGGCMIFTIEENSFISGKEFLTSCFI